MENELKTTIMGLYMALGSLVFRVRGFRVLVVYGLGSQGSRVVGLKV